MRPTPYIMLAALLCVVLAGCGAPAATPTAAPQAPAAQGGGATQGSPSGLVAMGLEQIRSEIDSGFPVETPVPEGEVVRGEAQGPDAWDYELIVSAPVSSVVDWYRQAYGSRSWAVTDERPIEGGGIEVTLQKGGAGTRVTATPEGQGTRVVVVLGIGESVLQTQ